jgi:hypothetical protein
MFRKLKLWYIHRNIQEWVIYLHRDVAVYCFNTQKISYYLRRDGGMNFLGIDLTPPWRDDFLNITWWMSSFM